MGTENLHHKRKQQTLASIKRRISRRDTYDVVLIVCEGTKSEPYYLKQFCDDRKLNSANIKVVGTGVDPLKIVDCALEKFNETKDYDRVFCVFDKDQHATYQDALNKIKTLRENSKNTIPIYGITSVPCFEYWILLHFIDSARPYNKKGNKSAGDSLLGDIRKYIKDYHKGYRDGFQVTKPNLKIALDRAKKIYTQQEKNETDNPSTNMHELIEYLDNIKKNNFKASYVK